MTAPHAAPPDFTLAGARVALVGKLAGMSRREAQQLLRAQGATVVETPDETTSLVVIGEGELPLTALDAALGERIEAGTVIALTETRLWQHLGYVDGEQSIHRLYTPAMLAELLGVPLAVVRRWHRRGLIVPVRQVRRLPYFDFQEVTTARRLAELLASGMAPQTIEAKLAELARLVPGIERPLAQLSVIVEGKQLLLRKGDGLIDSAGQLRIDFEGIEAERSAGAGEEPATVSIPLGPVERPPVKTPDELCDLAAALEDAGQLSAAADAYRAALVAGGPRADICFLLAELLYRLGDLPAARERYYMAIELDEDYVEARANLGCVLAETGSLELAVAAFEGALAFHSDYPDVHYHLARTLDDLGRSSEAEGHWRTFLALAAASPWADMARQRLDDGPPL